MNKHLEAAQKATEQLIRDGKTQLSLAKQASDWHGIADMENYIAGLEQIQVVYNATIFKIKCDNHPSM